MLGIQLEISYAGPNKEIVIINARGYIDNTTAPGIDIVMKEQLASGRYKIIVNLKEINYISSAGWGVFVSEIREIRDHNGDIVLANMSPDVHNVFELMEFSSILKSFESMNQAVSYFMGTKVSKEQNDTVEVSLPTGNNKQSVFDTTISPIREKEVPASLPTKAVRSDINESLSLTHTDLGRNILKVVLDYPYFTVKEITKILRFPQYGGKKGKRLAVKRQLKFMDLMDKKKRFEFAMRKKL